MARPAVAFGVPAFLSPLPPDAPQSRFGLARGLFADGHPLTARVAVNRAWQHVFGEGLVRTPEDFGTQGDKPVHQELLDTLVMWGGEFGRTPFGQGPSEQPSGRDRFGRAFAWWQAGGGVRPGHVHGATDECGRNIVDGRAHVHDLQATVLHLCGIDHERLTFRRQGRDFRLTDVHGKVVRAVLG